MAPRKVDAIERLAKSADLLTRTILNIFGRDDVHGLCPHMLDYTHLVQETRNCYSPSFYDALMAFYRCAQSAYTQMAVLQSGVDAMKIARLHGEVELTRHQLSEAMQRELYGT